MMNKKIIFLTAFSCCIFAVFSQDKNQSASQSALDKTWSKVTEFFSSPSKELAGQWNYRDVACIFETENLLKKAGGSIVAAQVEKQFDEYLQKVGIKKGESNFVFNTDSTYSAHLGLLNFSGKYSVNPETKQMEMTFLKGIGKIKATPLLSGNRFKLLFDADSFLKLMKTMSMFTKDNSIEILAAMADMYDGMLLGFDLKRQ